MDFYSLARQSSTGSRLKKETLGISDERRKLQNLIDRAAIKLESEREHKAKIERKIEEQKEGVTYMS